MTPNDSTDPSSCCTNNSDQDALLTQYREVRTEIRELERGIQRQTFTGVIIVGTIFGYSLTTNTLWLLLGIPIIIGYLIAIVGHTWISVMFLALHSHNIETRISEPEFTWETNYGELWDGNNRIIRSCEPLPFIGHVNWSELPKHLTMGLVVILYFAAIFLAIAVVWIETPGIWKLLTSILALLGYGLYSVLIGLVAEAYQAVDIELNRRYQETEHTP